MRILDFIDRDELKRLSERSNRHAVWMTVANFGLIGIAFAIPILWTHWIAWCLASALLAGRALGLGILVHEAAHLTLFSSRKVNEWAGKWLFGGLPNVRRTWGLPAAIRRRFLLIYYLGPPAILGLLRSMGTVQDQRDAPFVPLYAFGVFSILFLVPVTMKFPRPTR